MLTYLALGTLLVIALHFGLRWLSREKPVFLRKLLKWSGLALALAGILLLFRFGFPYIASIMSGLIVLAAFFNRWGGLLYGLFRFFSPRVRNSRRFGACLAQRN